MTSGLTERSQYLRAIDKLKPSISQKEKNKLSAALFAIDNSGTCSIDWEVLLAVAFLESSLKCNSINTETHDIGLMQINIRNIIKKKLNRYRLMNDHLYALNQGCRILEQHKLYLKGYPFWIGSYKAGLNIGRPQISKIAKNYHNAVMKKLQEMEE